MLISFQGIFAVVVIQQVSAVTAGSVRNFLRPRQTTVPVPIVVAPSQDWDGIDGPWSSFALQIGTPSQNVKVFVGTGSYEQLVVLPQGCVASDPSNCGALRGGEFEVNQSTTWQTNNLYSNTSIYALDFETRLGLDGNGEFGYDDITLGWQGSGAPTLKNQSVGGIATKDFFLGLLGLNPRPANFTTYNNPIPSFLQNLRSSNLIPSLSWSYTAGNQYRSNQVLGSLVLGGYDTSKYISNNLSWPFNSRDLIDISVNIQNISSTFSQTSLLTAPISAYMDSSVPQIWLPLEACQLFEKEFGIIWNDALQLYLVNNTQHSLLVAENTSVVFTLGSLTSTETVNITLPYAAFDLTLSAPLVADTVRYFPLKRATNDTQYTLGRTFFQEAYLTADYERRNFSVSQCNWDVNAPSKIVAIIPPDSSSSANGTIPNTPSATSGTVPQTSKPSRLSTGAIAGIAVGAVVILAIAGILIYLFVIRRRAANSQEKFEKAEMADNSVFTDGNKIVTHINDEKVRNSTLETFEIDGLAKDRSDPVEADGVPVEMFEMEAREEVAVEIGDGLASNEEANEREVLDPDIENLTQQ